MKILEAVNTEVNYRGSSCTELVMDDGTRLYMKTATFDKDLSITAKAKSLIGKKVKTSCWDPIGEFGKWSRQGYFRNIYELSDFDYVNEVLKTKAKRNATIYPSRENWFKAFEYSSFANTKVIILGQDPYHGEGQAEGLSFSVSKGMDIPPSLRNIFKELENDDVEFTSSDHGNLVSWAKQGVLLLNSVLTVEKLSPASHANLGWEIITDQVIRLLSEKKENLVFIFWGAYANKKKELIDEKKHLVLSASHPSPFSATKGSSDFKGFVGCKHFSQTNNYLKKHNHQTINWSIPL
jgi:uracil-DNA glycosylase